jgi:hypothetical protein
MVSVDPISIWMQEQAGRSWFAIDGDSLRAAFERDERLRGPFERMSAERTEIRLEAHARLRASATSTVGKVNHPRGERFAKLHTADEEPGRPLMQLPNGLEWEFRFVKIACNLAGPCGSNTGDILPNELPTLLRKRFGPDAGLPGPRFEDEFHREGNACSEPAPAATSETSLLASAPS